MSLMAELVKILTQNFSCFSQTCTHFVFFPKLIKKKTLSSKLNQRSAKNFTVRFLGNFIFFHNFQQ